VARENVGPWKRCVLREKTRPKRRCGLKGEDGLGMVHGEEMGLGMILPWGKGFVMVGK
jgi:hypothetical protein